MNTYDTCLSTTTAYHIFSMSGNRKQLLNKMPPYIRVASFLCVVMFA